MSGVRGDGIREGDVTRDASASGEGGGGGGVQGGIE